MKNLLMISGSGAGQTARGVRNAFWNTLEEFHQYWNRIDVLYRSSERYGVDTLNQFGNVFFHPTIDLARTGIDLIAQYHHEIMTVQEYFPFRHGRAAQAIWRATRIPYVLEIHHIPGYPRAANLREFIARNATRYYVALDARNAALVRVVNEHQAPDFLIRAGIPREKIRYIPSMYINLDVFQPLNIPKKYDILFVGRRAANKGIHLFHGVAKELSKGRPDFRSLIVDGWAKDSEELARIYNESRLFIVSSYNEGGPRVLLEAMACGTSVLSTRVGLAPELLENEFLADWSVNDLAVKAARILAQPQNTKHHHEIASRFEKHAMIKNYAETLTHIR